MTVDSPRPASSLVASALVVGGAVALWWVVALVQVGGRPLLASPPATAIALVANAPSLALDLLATFARAAVGLLFGLLGGLVLGVLVAALARRAPVADALLDVGRSVPPVVWLPVFLLAFGFGDASRVATIAAGVAVILAVAVTTAAKAPRTARDEQLLLSGATSWQRLRWTQPWASLPALLVGLRVASSMAVVVATVTEMVAGAPRGIGTRIVSAQVAGDTPQLTAAIVVVGLSGWALGRCLAWLERGAARLVS